MNTAVTIAEIPDPIRYGTVSREAAELLSESVYGGALESKEVLEGISDDLTTTVVAIDNHAKTIGAATFWLCNGDAYIGSMGVEAASQKQGIGRRMADRVEELVARQGAEAIIVTPVSSSAEKFWKHLGYIYDGGDDLIKKLPRS